MAVKSIMHSSGKTLRFGRARPVVRHPALRLGNYLKAIAAPPASMDYAPHAAATLAEMYGNDVLGDCVVAAVGHVEGVMTANAGSEFLFTDAEITAIYSGACGYVPGNANSDQGCDIQTTLAYWRNKGAPIGSAHKPVGWLAVDPANKTEMMTAIWLFENLIFGIELPDAWVNLMPTMASGFVWDVAGAPDPNNGHCFPGVGYSAAGVKISTWAMTGILTWAAIAKYAAASAQGELYVVLDQDMINVASQLAPSGLNWAQLVADFNALGGNVTPPTPTPTPAPTPPTPPMPPSPPSSVIVNGFTPAALAQLAAVFKHHQPFGGEFDEEQWPFGRSGRRR